MMPSGRVGQTLAYGKACLECSRSKCKCIPRANRQGCERCHRLDKTCVPGGSVRALGAQKNNAINRIAQLEGKLDGLVSLLGTARVLDQAPAATSTLPSPPQQAAPPPPPPPPPPQVISSPGSVPLSGGSGPTGGPRGSGPLESYEPSWSESEECLGRFRTEMLQYFPFLDLSSDAHQLARERPFLFRCIVAAAAPSTALKLALGRAIKQTLAQRIVVETSPGAITLDLLLGLLVFLVWGHDYILHSNPASLSRFTQLALAVVFELRLNKTPPAESNMLPGGSQSQECSLRTQGSCRSLDEIRALFACYIMSSIVSSYLAQIDPLQWTPYMDDCLSFLSANGDCPNDQILACQVRLQLIAADTETVRNTATAPTFYLKSLRAKVSQIKSSIPADLGNNRALSASLYYTELSILSLALSDKSDKPGGPGLQRLEAQYECLNIIKNALDSFFSMPLEEYSSISFPFFTHLARYILVLYKLSTMDDASQDGNLVRSSVDVLQVMDRLIGNIQQARSMDGERSAGGLLDKSIKIFASVRQWCAAKLAEESRLGDADNTLGISYSNSTAELDLYPFEDAWLRDNFNLALLDGQDWT